MIEYGFIKPITIFYFNWLSCIGSKHSIRNQWTKFSSHCYSKHTHTHTHTNTYTHTHTHTHTHKQTSIKEPYHKIVTNWCYSFWDCIRAFLPPPPPPPPLRQLFYFSNKYVSGLYYYIMCCTGAKKFIWFIACLYIVNKWIMVVI